MDEREDCEKALNILAAGALSEGARQTLQRVNDVGADGLLDAARPKFWEKDLNTSQVRQCCSSQHTSDLPTAGAADPNVDTDVKGLLNLGYYVTSFVKLQSTGAQHAQP